MAHVAEILSVEFVRFEASGGAKLLLLATGEVSTSGWSGLRLAPRFYAVAPEDGLWEFDFLGTAPRGQVVDAAMPVAAQGIHGLPAWFEGVKVYAATNSETATQGRTAPLTGAPGEPAARRSDDAGSSVVETLAVYEDGFGGASRAAQGSQRHCLSITIDGPDEVHIRRALADAAACGLVAPLVAAYPQGGGALAAGASALLADLQARLGGRFRCRIDDRAEWVEARD